MLTRCRVQITGFVGIFFPFSRLTDGLMAGGGCILFSLYIVRSDFEVNLLVELTGCE